MAVNTRPKAGLSFENYKGGEEPTIRGSLATALITGSTGKRIRNSVGDCKGEKVWIWEERL